MKKNVFLNMIDEVNIKFKSIIGLACLSGVIFLIGFILLCSMTSVAATAVLKQSMQDLYTGYYNRGGWNQQTAIQDALTRYTSIQATTYNTFLYIGLAFLIFWFVSSIILIFLLIQVFTFQSKIETDYNLYLHDKIDNNDQKENYKQERFERILESLAESKKTMSIIFWITWFIGLNIIAVIFLILTWSKINSYNKIIIDSFKDQ